MKDYNLKRHFEKNYKIFVYDLVVKLDFKTALKRQKQ